MLIKDKVICLRSVDYSETSQIVTFFTREHGKVGAIAKGARRAKSRFGEAFEVLAGGSAVLSRGEESKLATLTEFEGEPALPLTSSFFGYNAALFAVELLNNMMDEYDPHPELFDKFHVFLDNLREANGDEERQRFLILFQLGLLSELGLAPVFVSCGNCKNRLTGNWGQIYFSSSSNSFVCRDCEAAFPDKQAVGGEAAKCLAQLNTLPSADAKTLREIEQLLVNYFTDILHKRPKMAKYVLM